MVICISVFGVGVYSVLWVSRSIFYGISWLQGLKTEYIRARKQNRNSFLFLNQNMELKDAKLGDTDMSKVSFLDLIKISQIKHSHISDKHNQTKPMRNPKYEQK